jgi:hypothetical protein
MTTYWEPEFVNALKDVDVKVVFEAGARTGEETITLSKHISKCKRIFI